MNTVNLTFEVHACIPSWISHVQDHIHIKSLLTDNRYRIFVNDNLIVERNWIWDNNIFLIENLWVTAGLMNYNVKLEPVIYNPAQIKFALKKVNLQNHINFYTDNQLELSFTI
jgi:hypothetical protein